MPKIDDHLNYTKRDQSNADNSRNGYTSRTQQPEGGLLELDTLLDIYHKLF